jgi:hypothetical protein
VSTFLETRFEFPNVLYVFPRISSSFHRFMAIVISINNLISLPKTVKVFLFLPP